MARREKGEGSISQRQDGKWTARLDLGKNIDGKRKIKAVYGKTSKEVKKKMKELQNEIVKYSVVNFTKISIDELLNDWKISIKKYELKPSSYDNAARR